MNEEPDIEYETAPAVVRLDGNEQEADASAFAGACARLRLYTSKPYLAEAGALFGQVADAFAHWPSAQQRLGTFTLTEWSEALRLQRASFERGLALLDAGYTAAAYAAIAEAVRDGLEPTDPRDERHLSLRCIADEIGDALSAAAARLGPMADRICTTLGARWAYPLLLDQTPAQDENLTLALGKAAGAARREEGSAFDVIASMNDAPEIATGRCVPKTGLWVPTTIRYGCPNFLIAGQTAAPMRRACKRYDYPARDGGGVEPPKAAWRAYEYAEESTVWRMAWYDARYRAGIAQETP